MPKRLLCLTPIPQLETDVQLAIRDIRNFPEVRKVMYTDHIIGTNEHLRWVHRLKTDASQIVFAIFDQGKSRPLGVFSISSLEKQNQRADWGFYLDPRERGHGIGTAVEMRMLEFAFETLALEKLNGTVLERNDPVLNFYEQFGFEKEGFRHSEIARDGARLGVHLLGLQKKNWLEKQAALSRRHAGVCEQFEIRIDWSPAQDHGTVIDQIEAARAKNNVNWMNILRIAVEKSPANAKQIVGEIRELDQQISALTAKIELEQ